MANITTNFTAANVGVTPELVYAAATPQGSIVSAVYLTNVTVSDIYVSVKAAGVYVTLEIKIPAKNTLVLENPIMLKNGDMIEVNSTAPSSLDVLGSVVVQA